MLLVKKLKLFLTPQLILYAKEEIKKFDVIHLHEYRTFQNIIIRHYATKYGVPYVLQAHGSLPRVGSWRKLKLVYDVLFGYRLLKDVSKVIALSDVEAEQYKIMGVPEDKIAIVPNGIDLSKYAELPPKGVFKKKFNIPEDKKIILYLGRIHKSKGIDFLTKSYAYLVKKMHFDDTILVIAGPDDGYLKEAKKVVTSLGVLSETVFTGPLTEGEKLSAYVDAHLVVNVEPRNVFGLVPLEAAACGKPVIVSQGNGIKEIIRQGEFGFSVKYGDVKRLAEIIAQMLENDYLREKMGENGRRFVFKNFSWRRIIEIYEEVYDDAMKSENSRS